MHIWRRKNLGLSEMPMATPVIGGSYSIYISRNAFRIYQNWYKEMGIK